MASYGSKLAKLLTVAQAKSMFSAAHRIGRSHYLHVAMV